MVLVAKLRACNKTDAGEMRVVKSHGRRIFEKLLHIGFIKIEPQTLFLPLYLDSNLILFVNTGQATVGLIYKDHMVERELKNGDVYQIPAGSTFCILNTEESQRLHIICSIDPSESLNIVFLYWWSNLANISPCWVWL
ncbi:vicilin-like seed storage protein At2g28490 [Gossypium hirsutum]|uniref:Vicilin-like seed storage protein At2g28490 n=1 Tax=Gossypium hirsutum TaxID=3635 RepID=A0ABM2ZQT8_GOSHI|nr:vicilin-like seed storage protein At2g28490 [Gossypium hirsutum]